MITTPDGQWMTRKALRTLTPPSISASAGATSKKLLSEHTR
jgi:hypothetical protein